MKIHEALGLATSLLRKASCSNPRLDAECLLGFCLAAGRSSLIAHQQDDLEPSREESFFVLVQKRFEGMPIQYIMSKQEFWGLEFEVDPHVLIPRPETELLVNEVLRVLPHRAVTVVDVGTGSGCIAVALAVERPDAEIFAIDVSEPALKVARRNAQNHKVESRIEFLKGDLLELLVQRREHGLVDCVCSNPPYVAERDLPSLQREVREWEPRIALAGGEDGLHVIDRLIPQALTVLKPGGYLVMEIGYNQQHQVAKRFTSGWRAVRMCEDLSGIPRIVVAERSGLPGVEDPSPSPK